MAKLTSFISLSLDGYFADPNGDMRWAHQPDPEFQAFVEANAKGGGSLVFGRKTYQMMASYWPSPIAAQHDPIVATRMNQLPKIVFSRTLTEATWQNTRLIREDMIGAVRDLKQNSQDDMVLLGSASIVSQLAQAGLMDAFQVVIIPIMLGSGRSMFEGLSKPINLRLTQSRTFPKGNVFLTYEPA